MVLTGKGRDHEGVKGLIRMETQTQADVDGGKVKIDDQNIAVEGADSVTLYVSSGTNFINYHDISGNESKKRLDIFLWHWDALIVRFYRSI